MGKWRLSEKSVRQSTYEGEVKVNRKLERQILEEEILRQPEDDGRYVSGRVRNGGARGGISRVLNGIDRGFEGMRGFYRELNKLMGNKIE